MEEAPLEQSWWCEGAEDVGQHIERQMMKKCLESNKYFSTTLYMWRCVCRITITYSRVARFPIG